MKFIFGTVLATLLLSSSFANAGIVIGGTRIIYDGNKKESSLSINNPDNIPYLIQTWAESVAGGAEKAPFIVTPPLFRLDGGQHNVLRVVRAGGSLPENKESLYWMNIKSIPSSEQQTTKNTLQIAVKTRIKLIYRPAGLNGLPEENTDKMRWSRSGNSLQVTNPTPFYMNFQQVSVGGKEIAGATYVAPGATTTLTLPAGAHASSVKWMIINDFGGVGPEHSAAL